MAFDNLDAQRHRQIIRRFLDLQRLSGDYLLCLCQWARDASLLLGQGKLFQLLGSRSELTQLVDGHASGRE